MDPSHTAMDIVNELSSEGVAMEERMGTEMTGTLSEQGASQAVKQFPRFRHKGKRLMKDF
jgi:hypothetical protein